MLFRLIVHNPNKANEVPNQIPNMKNIQITTLSTLTKYGYQLGAELYQNTLIINTKGSNKILDNVKELHTGPTLTLAETNMESPPKKQKIKNPYVKPPSVTPNKDTQPKRKKTRYYNE